MKRIISILISVLIVFSCSITAFADYMPPWDQDNNDNLNFNHSTSYFVNDNEQYGQYIDFDFITDSKVYNGNKTEEYEVTYTGPGELLSWEFPLLEEGKDYLVLSQEKNTINVLFFNEKDIEIPYVNAVVDFGNGPKEPITKNESHETDEDINYKEAIKKENKMRFVCTIIDIILVCIALALCLKK